MKSIFLLPGVLLGVCSLALWSGGCAVPDPADAPRYFDNPEAAVETATPLLRAGNWVELARYYDLSGSAVARAELLNGSFFFSDRVEGMQHPSGLSRYKHPFPPGFRFLRQDPGPRPDTTKVTVQIEIDQGTGVPAQRGRAAFLLRRSARGYQLLPEKIDP